ncbi:hypothetical protein ACWEGS_34330 [Streptomyces sp. NPDC004822]
MMRTFTRFAPQAFWRQRSWLLAAGFLVLTVVISLVAALTRTDDTPESAAGAAHGPLLNRPTGATGRPGTCRTDDSAGAVPTTAPTDVRWRLVAGSRIPVSATAGPKVSSGPVQWCFAHTPLGAVMAAHVIPAQMNADHWRTVVAQQVTPGLGREIFASQRASINQTALKGQATGTYAGFLVSHYDKERASVDLLVKSSQGGLTSSTVNVRWDGGDWKIQPGTDGALHSTARTVRTADGYIPWET